MWGPPVRPFGQPNRTGSVSTEPPYSPPSLSLVLRFPWRASRLCRRHRVLVVFDQLRPPHRHQNIPLPRLGLLTKGIELRCLIASSRILSGSARVLVDGVCHLQRAWLLSLAKLSRSALYVDLGSLAWAASRCSLMSTHASVLVDSVGPPSAEVCRTATSFS
jgi:hypothetical protein